MDSFRILRLFIYSFCLVYTSSECCTDFLFVIDGSTKLKSKFKDVIDTALEIASGLNVDKQQHRVALLEFGSNFGLNKWPKYRIGQINTQKKLENTIAKLPNLEGISNKAKAFDVVQKEMLYGHRSDVPLVIFTISDGHFQSNSEKEMVRIRISELAVQKDVHLFAATLDYSSLAMSIFTNGNSATVVSGRNVAQRSLKLLKTFIDCTAQTNSVSAKTVKSSGQKNLWQSETTKLPAVTVSTTMKLNKLDGLGHKKWQKPTVPVEIRKKTALNLTALHTTSTTTAKRPAPIRSGCQYDIVLLMDFSGGTEDKRTSYIQLASSLIAELELGPEAVQVCMIRYSGPGREDTVFHLNKHGNSAKAIEEMSAASHMGGTTRTGEAIRYATDEFNEKNGGRRNAVKMMVVFTDGYSQEDPTQAAQQARKSGINIRVVAVDDEDLPPNRKQLNEIAGNSENVYISSEFGKLQSQIVSQFRRCT